MQAYYKIIKKFSSIQSEQASTLSQIWTAVLSSTNLKHFWYIYLSRRMSVSFHRTARNHPLPTPLLLRISTLHLPSCPPPLIVRKRFEVCRLPLDTRTPECLISVCSACCPASNPSRSPEIPPEFFSRILSHSSRDSIPLASENSWLQSGHVFYKILPPLAISPYS